MGGPRHKITPSTIGGNVTNAGQEPRSKHYPICSRQKDVLVYHIEIKPHREYQEVNVIRLQKFGLLIGLYEGGYFVGNIISSVNRSLNKLG